MNYGTLTNENLTNPKKGKSLNTRSHGKMYDEKV